MILRNNRWRCDHGWDIDLDDGSTNYELRNNLCLNGGIKNREGFYRVVENNVIVNNGFHPHVWFKHSEDVVRRNIFWTDHYLPAGGMPSTPWGREMDYNLVHRSGLAQPEPAGSLARQSKRDEHSLVADAMYVDAARGDFRVKDGSPALTLGFTNFPMDQFGVQSPKLRAIARTPELPKLAAAAGGAGARPAGPPSELVWQARVRNITGLGDRSVYGLPAEEGVLVLEVPAGTPAARAGLQKDDVDSFCQRQAGAGDRRPAQNAGRGGGAGAQAGGASQAGRGGGDRRGVESDGATDQNPKPEIRGRKEFRNPTAQANPKPVRNPNRNLLAPRRLRLGVGVPSE